jgi:hypothetical protein
MPQQSLLPRVLAAAPGFQGVVAFAGAGERPPAGWGDPVGLGTGEAFGFAAGGAFALGAADALGLAAGEGLGLACGAGEGCGWRAGDGLGLRPGEALAAGEGLGLGLGLGAGAGEGDGALARVLLAGAVPVPEPAPGAGAGALSLDSGMQSKLRLGRVGWVDGWVGRWQQGRLLHSRATGHSRSGTERAACGRAWRGRGSDSSLAAAAVVGLAEGARRALLISPQTRVHEAVHLATAAPAAAKWEWRELGAGGRHARPAAGQKAAAARGRNARDPYRASGTGFDGRACCDAGRAALLHALVPVRRRSVEGRNLLLGMGA